MRYDPDFEDFWSVFPKRDIDYKREAFRCWGARLRAGIVATDLTEAARNYAAYCRQKGIIGTQFVMRAATFLGPNERWLAFKGGDLPAHVPDTSKAAVASVTEPPEERVDMRREIAELLRGLATKKKSPTCTHERGGK